MLKKEGPWIGFCDGAARGNPGPAAAAFVVFDAEGGLVGKEKVTLGRTTNNEAEYRALLLCLKFLNGKGERRMVMIFSDSQLLVNQMKGLFKVKDRNLQSLVMEAKRLESALAGRVEYFLVPREANIWADKMVNEALDREGI